MYGLRKPFAAAEYQGMIIWGIDFKILLIISQVAGYAISKFAGIKYISEMKRSNRAVSIIILTAAAELSLIFFSIIPYPVNMIFLFLNGLPLGMIWGLVFSYLEGRRTTEILGASLSISFIVSSGFVKSTGSFLQDVLKLTDFQMPWITGLVFFVPLLLFVWLLDNAPDPSNRDIESRMERKPMTGRDRIKTFKQFAPAIIILTCAYLSLTIGRDLRDNFAAEIWNSIGYKDKAMIFTWSELPVAITGFIVLGLLMFIKTNWRALTGNVLVIFSGFTVTVASTVMMNKGIINPAVWMIIYGTGIYIGYLPFNSILFDRLIAAFGSNSNAGFFIYMADSFGYLGSVGVLIFKSFLKMNISWLEFISSIMLPLAFTGMILTIIAYLYLKMKYREQEITPKGFYGEEQQLISIK
jgi:hypothetical protein